jgi:signal transduction histidine kinase/CheY-like chemotaxis protein
MEEEIGDNTAEFADLQRYREMSESAQTGWWESNTTTKEYLFSENICRLLGIQGRTLSFEEVLLHVREDYRDLILHEFFEFSSRKNTFYKRDFPILTPNGEVWLRTQLIRHYRRNGCEGSLGIIQVIPASEGANEASVIGKVTLFLKQLNNITLSLSDYLKGKTEDFIINNILQNLLDFYKANNAFMFEFDENGLYQGCTHEAARNNKMEIKVSYTHISNTDVPWLTRNIIDHQPIIVDMLTQLPGEAKEERTLFSSIGIKSLMCVPLTDEKRVWGYIGIDTTEGIHHWSNEDYRWLMSMGSIMSICIGLSRAKDETKHAYTAARRSDKLFKDIFINIPIGEAIYDKDGQLTDMNNAFMETFGLTSMADADGFSFFKDANMTPELRDNILKNNPSTFNIEYSFDKVTNYKTRRKGEANFNCKMIRIFDEKEPGYLFICIEDTDRLVAIDKARDFENFFSMISDYAKVGYAKINLKTHEGYAIRQWFKNMGEDEHTPLANIVGNYAHMHPDDKARLLQFFEEVKEGKTGGFIGEIRIRRPGTEDKWNWIYKNLLVSDYDPDGGGIEIIGVNYDITAFKEVEQELTEARDKAQMMDKLKSAFLANMSHEIRTPLNAIVGFSDLIATTDEKEEREQYLPLLHENNELLLQLISDILDLSKMEAGTMEFNYSNVDVNELCMDIVRSMRFKAREGVAIIFDTFRPVCNIFTDPNRLNQVISNFINNAIKFTTEGSIRLGYEWVDMGHLRFYVTDTGMGISADEVDSIFERFVKLNSFAQGTGLGLSICRNIVEQMGGTIGVDSELGKGSTFWFILPGDQEKSEFNAASVSAQPVVSDVRPVFTSATGEKPKILIAEDTQSNFALMNAILKNDFELHRAINGIEAVRKCQSIKPDLILMDVKMPHIDGLEATRRIRTFDKNVPIIAVTAFAFEQDRRSAMAAGCNGYLTKPISGNVLKDIIIRELTKK